MTDINDKENYKTLYGLVKLSQSIECESSVLGCREPISVGGIRGHLLFPKLPDWETEHSNPLGKRLLPPVPAKTWKHDVCWGYPTTYPSGESSVELLLLEFLLPEAELKVSANAIYLALPKWRAMFLDYLELTIKQQLYSESEISPTHDHLDLFTWTDEDLIERVHDRIEQEIVVLISNEDHLLNSQSLKDICRHSSIARQPALAYRLMLEAYKAFNAKDYRKAIIEAATAAEIVLGQEIKLTLMKTNVSYADQLLKKYRMLSGRFELAEMVGIQLPRLRDEYQKVLIEPRNEVVHRANFADAQISLRTIKAVDELLTCISPSMSEK